MDTENIPQHVAIIMDGNGRWADKKGFKRSKGHIEGARRVEDIIDTALEVGVRYITLFTFSTENWKRPKTEVKLLMNMIDAVVKRKLSKMMKDDIRLRIIGREDGIPEPVLSTIRKGIKKTKDNKTLTLNLAFNYGSRKEIVDAVKNIASAVKNDELSIEDIDEELMSKNLYTADMPDPELLVRTSGEMRISNFLLWQISYAEFYFTDKFWPEFDNDEFKKAISVYQKRKRRFGGLIEDDE